MSQGQDSGRNKKRCASSMRFWPLVVGLLLLQADAVLGAQAGGGPAQTRSFTGGQIFGAVLAIIQVALGLQIILNSLQKLWV
jgi:hypothetical protein